MRQHSTLLMGWCVDCHRANPAAPRRAARGPRINRLRDLSPLMNPVGPRRPAAALRRRELLAAQLPAPGGLRDLGEHRLLQLLARAGAAGRPPPSRPRPSSYPGGRTAIASTCGRLRGWLRRARPKCRDGRPIKLEGIPETPAVSAGGLCAGGAGERSSALYDSQSASTAPQHRGRVGATWDASGPRARRARSTSCARRGGRVRLLTGTVNGPSTRAAIRAVRIAELRRTSRHVAYDVLDVRVRDPGRPRSETHGRARPCRGFSVRAARGRSSSASTRISSSTWISPVEFTAGLHARAGIRSTGPVRGCRGHFQLRGSHFSLTGCRMRTERIARAWLA